MSAISVELRVAPRFFSRFAGRLAFETAAATAEPMLPPRLVQSWRMAIVRARSLQSVSAQPGSGLGQAAG
jgi:hypothetical protein